MPLSNDEIEDELLVIVFLWFPQNPPPQRASYLGASNQPYVWQENDGLRYLRKKSGTYLRKLSNWPQS